MIDLRPVFTPGGVYGLAKRWLGQTVTVREPDGIHLTMAGSVIATDLLVLRLHKDGILK